MIRKGIKVENKDFKLIYLAGNLACSLHHKKSDVIHFLAAHLRVINPQGPVVRSLVSANRWLRGIKTYRFPWYLTLDSANRWLRGIKTYRFPWYLMLVSANHASSNPGQDFKLKKGKKEGYWFKR